MISDVFLEINQQDIMFMSVPARRSSVNTNANYKSKPTQKKKKILKYMQTKFNQIFVYELKNNWCITKCY